MTFRIRTDCALAYVLDHLFHSTHPLGLDHGRDARATLHKLVTASVLLFLLGGAGFLKAQGSNAVTVSGTVKDPSGAVIPGATVTIYNPVSGFTRKLPLTPAAAFSIPNVPFNPYHMTVTATGFAPHVQDLDVNSAVPLNLNIALELAGGKDRGDGDHRSRGPD